MLNIRIFILTEVTLEAIYNHNNTKKKKKIGMLK
tara:strand:+ start:745 stop:846 length:102 start_codon:yes stop_codon:yes gene_type:complete